MKEEKEGTKGFKILLMTKDPLNMVFIGHALKEALPNSAVNVFDNSKEAWDYLREDEQEPDVLIVDMDYRNGLSPKELAKLVQERNQNILLVALAPYQISSIVGFNCCFPATGQPKDLAIMIVKELFSV